jgi:hypothetical protein
MKITPELVAKLIFSSSQLRYFERELAADPRAYELQDIVTKWQCKVDEVLIEMGVEEFIPLMNLIETIKLEYNAETNTEKEGQGVENAD